MNTAPKTQGWGWLVLPALGALYLAFLFPSPEYNAYNKDDSSCFVALGMNLAHYGRFTVDAYPTADYGRHGTWPFGFPALLGAVIALVGVSWFALKLLMACLGIVNLWLLWCLWRGRPVRWWAVVLTGLNPTYFLFSHVTMTEIPFMLAVTGTLLAMSRAKGLPMGFAVGLLAGAAFLTRGYGVSLLPAGVLFFLFQRSWPLRRRLAVATVFAVPLLLVIVGWRLYAEAVFAAGRVDSVSQAFGYDAGILSRVFMPPGQIAREIYWYHVRFPIHFLAPIVSLEAAMEIEPLIPVSLALLALAAIGWVWSVRTAPSAVEFWFPFGMSMLLVKDASARYWLTFLPFLLYYILFALWKTQERWRAFRWPYRAACVVLLLMSVCSLVLHLANPDRLRFLNPYWRNYRDLAIWAESHLPAEAVIVTHYPAQSYTTALRRSYSLEGIDVTDWPPAPLAAEPHVYLLGPVSAEVPVYPEHRSAFLRLVNSGRFEKVHQEGQAALYLETGRSARPVAGGR